LQDAISEHKMAPLYRFLSHPTEGILNPAGEGTAASSQKFVGRKPSTVGMVATGSSKSASLPWDEDVYEKLKAENDQELDDLRKEEEEAVEKAGDTEVTAARGKRAEFYARVGDKVRKHAYMF
jgi:26S proteasome regulatory subunit N7